MFPALKPKQNNTSPLESSSDPVKTGVPGSVLDRRHATQSKRKTIAVACQPCRHRKNKCDGQRPTCTSCLVRNRTDCTYDVDGDQRRTNALKSRIQTLSKEIEDLKDIIRGVASAADLDQARATVHQLADQSFLNTAEVADAFRAATFIAPAASETSIVGSNMMLDPQMLKDFISAGTPILPPSSTIERSERGFNFSATGELSIYSRSLDSQTNELSSAIWPPDEQAGQFLPVPDVLHTAPDCENQDQEYMPMG